MFVDDERHPLAVKGGRVLNYMMTPEEKKKLDDVHLAICGDKRIGVDGLVKDVRDLKAFRRGVELRVATISGGITVAFFAIKALWTKISS